jgi:hypothetical protein
MTETTFDTAIESELRHRYHQPKGVEQFGISTRQAGSYFLPTRTRAREKPANPPVLRGWRFR